MIVSRSLSSRGYAQGQLDHRSEQVVTHLRLPVHTLLTDREDPLNKAVLVLELAPVALELGEQLRIV